MHPVSKYQTNKKPFKVREKQQVINLWMGGKVPPKGVSH